jgi:hypothetical protein
MNSEHFIFVGFELTEKVNGLLEACSERDRIYLKDPAYLEVVSIDNKRFVGKRVKGGMAIDRIEDAARSVVSLLVRVNPNWEYNSSQALVIAVEEGSESPKSLSEEDEEASARFDYLGLVD